MSFSGLQWNILALTFAFVDTILLVLFFVSSESMGATLVGLMFFFSGLFLLIEGLGLSAVMISQADRVSGFGRNTVSIVGAISAVVGVLQVILDLL